MRKQVVFVLGIEPRRNRLTQSIAVLEAEIDRLQDQRSRKVVELQHLHEQKAEVVERAETKAIRKSIRLSARVLLSYRAIRLEAGQSSGSSEPLPAPEDSGQDQDSRAILK